MLLGFRTDNIIEARAAFVIYIIYRSRDRKRGPSGSDMWGQIERYAKACAKRAEGIGDFIDAFKRKMACSTINPYWMRNEIQTANAVMDSNGDIMVFQNSGKTFGLEILEDDEHGKEVVNYIYTETQLIILLVRDRLEREKTIGVEEENEN